MISPEDVRERLAHVRGRIDAAASRVGRDGSSVTLVAVTKTHPRDVVVSAVGAGASDLGENYVNELAGKRDAAPGARWHFIGTLQSHTAHRVAELADVVHSAVPGRALERLAARASERRRELPVLLQVDLAGRGTAVPPEDVPGALDAVHALRGIRVIGLMTLPPPPDDPEDSREAFARLRELRDATRKHASDLLELSMGMSLDYEIAVEEGASMVRVGTALFGPRPPRVID